jgi:hypothetical protein
MTEEDTDNRQSSDKNTDPSTMNEQEMKELLLTMLNTAPNNAIKDGIQNQIDEINNKQNK